jgi:hypothetical protein
VAIVVAMAQGVPGMRSLASTPLTGRMTAAFAEILQLSLTKMMSRAAAVMASHSPGNWLTGVECAMVMDDRARTN